MNIIDKTLKKCPNCGTLYDEEYDACPNCGTKNTSFLIKKKKSNISWFNPFDQIIFIIVGFFGLFTAAFILEIFGTAIQAGDNFFALENNLAYLSIFIFFIVYCLTNKRYKSFKYINKVKPYLIGAAIGVGLFLVTILYGNLIAPLTDGEINGNQQAVENLFKVYPTFSIIITVFIGPFVEEMTYRVGLFSLLSRRKKWLAYLVGILAFALIHFDFTGTLKIELLNLVSYILAGATLCVTYEYFGLAGSYTAHLINNAICVLIIMLG